MVKTYLYAVFLHNRKLIWKVPISFHTEQTWYLLSVGSVALAYDLFGRLVSEGVFRVDSESPILVIV